MALCLASTTVLADEIRPSSSLALEEIIVTAQHREASLKDTPISISAFSEAMLKDIGFSNVQDIGQYTPNLTISPLINGRSGFAIGMRGVRLGDTLASGDSAVGVYMDGVLIGKNAGGLLDVISPERLEVLRGPQGTLYGRNTIAGAVNVITKKPGDALEGELRTTLGRYDQRDVRGSINIPLLPADSAIGSLAARISAATLNRDGFYKNRAENAPQRDIQDVDRNVVLAHVLWDPSDLLSVRYSYDRTEIDESTLPPLLTYVNSEHPTGSALQPYLINGRPSSVYLDGEIFGVSEVEGHALNLSFDLSEDVTLQSITAYRSTEVNGGGDSDGAPIFRFHSHDTSNLDVFTQEFRLIGSAWGSSLDYVAGAYYMKEDGDQVNTIQPYIQLAPGLGVIMDQADATDFDVTAKALYVQGTYFITDRWDVTAGVRYTDEERSMSKLRTTQFIGSGLPASQLVYPKAKKSFSNLSGTIAASFDWTDQITTYGKIAQGYQSGGLNARDDTLQDFSRGFDEEFLISYEIGWKSTFLDRRYRFDGAVFYSDYDDKIVNSFNPETAANIMMNSGKMKIWGVELEFLARVSDSFELGFDYGFTDAEYKTFTDLAGNDLRGSNIPWTPEHTGNIFVKYERPVSDLALLTARLDWTYRDEITFLVPAPEINSASSRKLWNARLTLSEIAGPMDSRVSVSLWGKNLTDEEYWDNGMDLYSSFGYAVNAFGDPRTFGIDLALEF